MRKKGYTLSERMIRDLDAQNTKRRSIHSAYTNEQTRQSTKTRPLYFKIISSSNYNSITFKWVYSCSLYINLGDATPVAESVLAINLHEWNNTNTSIPNYDNLPTEEEAECGEVYGCAAIPNNKWFKAIGYRYDTTLADWVWEFDFANELLVKE